MNSPKQIINIGGRASLTSPNKFFAPNKVIVFPQNVEPTTSTKNIWCGDEGFFSKKNNTT